MASASHDGIESLVGPMTLGAADVMTVLSPSAERDELRQTFSRFAARVAPLAVARRAEPSGFDAELWSELPKVDALGLAVPQSAGGSGAGMVEAALLAIELGAVLAPVPFAEAAA